MSVRALASDNEVCVNTENVVTSALSTPVTVWLPVIGNGSGGTVADDAHIAVYANGTGGIYVKDNVGRMLGFVRSGTAKLFNADGTLIRWNVLDYEELIQFKAAQKQAVGAGAAIAFGATTPGAITTPAAVNCFMKVSLDDGTTGYIPVWK